MQVGVVRVFSGFQAMLPQQKGQGFCFPGAPAIILVVGGCGAVVVDVTNGARLFRQGVCFGAGCAETE